MSREWIEAIRKEREEPQRSALGILQRLETRLEERLERLAREGLAPPEVRPEILLGGVSLKRACHPSDPRQIEEASLGVRVGGGANFDWLMCKWKASPWLAGQGRMRRWARSILLGVWPSQIERLEAAQERQALEQIARALSQAGLLEGLGALKAAEEALSLQASLPKAAAGAKIRKGL